MLLFQSLILLATRNTPLLWTPKLYDKICYLFIFIHAKYFKGFVKHEILKSLVCSNPSAEGKELMAILESYLDDNYLTLCSRDRLKNLKEKMHFQQIRDYVPFMGEIMELESSFGIVFRSLFNVLSSFFFSVINIT